MPAKPESSPQTTLLPPCLRMSEARLKASGRMAASFISYRAGISEAPKSDDRGEDLQGIFSLQARGFS